jgi:hypothetical protein
MVAKTKQGAARAKAKVARKLPARKRTAAKKPRRHR